jgi:hypothetical protein
LAAAYVNSLNYDDARAQEYNIQLQDQIGKTMVVSIGYAGSKDDRLNYTGKVNAAQSASPAGTPATTIDALKLVPWASPAWNYSSSTGYSNYNALLVQFQKRFSTSLSTIASYTWSKCLDNSSGFFNAENGIGGGSVRPELFQPQQRLRHMRLQHSQLPLMEHQLQPAFRDKSEILQLGRGLLFLGWLCDQLRIPGAFRTTLQP